MWGSVIHNIDTVVRISKCITLSKVQWWLSDRKLWGTANQVSWERQEVAHSQAPSVPLQSHSHFGWADGSNPTGTNTMNQYIKQVLSTSQENPRRRRRGEERNHQQLWSLFLIFSFFFFPYYPLSGGDA